MTTVGSTGTLVPACRTVARPNTLSPSSWNVLLTLYVTGQASYSVKRLAHTEVP